MQQRRLKVELTVPPVSVLAPENSHLELDSRNFEPQFRSSLDWLVYKKHLKHMQSVDHTPLTGLFKYWIWFRFFVLRSGIFEPPGNSHLKMHWVLIGNFEKNPLEVPRCWFVAGVAWKFF